MKNTKNVILGALSCLLLAVGFAQSIEAVGSKHDTFVPSATSLQMIAHLPKPGPSDDGPPAHLPKPGSGDDGPPAHVLA